MPSDNRFAFRYETEPMDVEAPVPRRKKPVQRDHPKAYKASISREQMEKYVTEWEERLQELQHISLTEFATFCAEGRRNIMEAELVNIRSKYFGFPVIQHSNHLVQFYTGLPTSTEFYHVGSMLQRWIFRTYIKWEADEKHGFLNHTMITLVKLRLNMTDEELADRFCMEPYIVKMTLRTWLPGLYICIYKTAEDVYRASNNDEDYSYSKVIDIVEVCFETPEYTRRLREDKHERRKALLSIRNDGFINYASSVVSVNRPDTEAIKKSRLASTCVNMDMIAVHTEHLSTVASMGIACRRMPPDAKTTIRDAVIRISEFRILMAIPEEYRTFHEYIFSVCAALSNFFLVDEENEMEPFNNGLDP